MRYHCVRLQPSPLSARRPDGDGDGDGNGDGNGNKKYSTIVTTAADRDDHRNSDHNGVHHNHDDYTDHHHREDDHDDYEVCFEAAPSTTNHHNHHNHQHAAGHLVARPWRTLPLIPVPQALCIARIDDFAKAPDTAHGTALLLRAAVCHLRSQSATKIMVCDDVADADAAHDDDDRRRAARLSALTALGFTHSNALVARNDGSYPRPSPAAAAASSQILVELWDEAGDAIALTHWRKMWLENGVTQLRPDADALTLAFIRAARTDGRAFKTIVALEAGTVVGSLCCNLIAPGAATATVWAVYVLPEHRKRGVATRLVHELKNYFFGGAAVSGVKRIDLIYASEAGARVYKKAGWKEDDVYCLERPDIDAIWNARVFPVDDGSAGGDTETEKDARLESALDALRAELAPEVLSAVSSPSAGDNVDADNDADTENRRLRSLLKTVPQQLAALADRVPAIAAAAPAIRRAQVDHGLLDPTWFERSRAKMGKGFDMAALASDPALLAGRFDRLALRWDDFIAGCRYDAIFPWLCAAARASPLFADPSSSTSSSSLCILDLCCGVGLPGQTLRLLLDSAKQPRQRDYHLVGLDISPGMLRAAKTRACYDELLVADANAPLPVPPGSADLVICTGAMELLRWKDALRHAAAAARPRTGEMWLSFQRRHEKKDGEGGEHDEDPTSHQGIVGVARDEVVSAAAALGWTAVDVVECPSAFVTPRDGRLLDVPYLFCRLVPAAAAAPS